MKRVLFRAPTLTQSGYGVHARGVMSWLLKQPNIELTCQILPWGDTPWMLNESDCNGLVGEVIKRSAMSAPQKFDVAFQLQLPNEWDTRLANYNVGMSAVVETDKCNPHWVEYCNAVDTVVVPSKHAKNCLTNTGNVTKPIHVIPEAYSNAITEEKKQHFNFSTSFNFLIVGQVTGNEVGDRKNVRSAVKWLCELFKDDTDVGIILKTNLGQNTKLDKHNTKLMLQDFLGSVRKSTFPKVHLLHGNMTDEEVASLYVHPTVKAYVSTTRGEGFGLPTLEAAVSGLPVIATNWSGHLDYLNRGKFIQVGYRLQDVHQSKIDSNPPPPDPNQRMFWERSRIFVPGVRWAEASEEDFKKKVSKFRTSNSVPKQWALELQQTLLPTHSQDNIESIYSETFKEILC